MNRTAMRKIAEAGALVVTTLVLFATPVVTMFLALGRATMAI
jgi:hypothetical protein